MAAKKIYSLEQEQKALQLRKEGVTVDKISEITGIKNGALRALFLKEGITLSGEQRSKNNPLIKHRALNVADVLELRAQGLSTKEIAEKFNVSVVLVNRFLKKNNLPNGRQAELSEDILNKIKNLHSQGLNRNKIAQSLNLPVNQVRMAYKVLGLGCFGRQEYSVNLPNEITKLRLEGFSRQAIADELGINIAKVNKVATNAGALSLDWKKEKVANRASEIGLVITDNYSGIDVKMAWKCQKGHEFNRTPLEVYHLENCPKCWMENKISKGHQEIQDFITSLGVVSETCVWEVLKGKELDIWVPSANFGLEFNGLYWHSSAAPNFKRGMHYAKAMACRAANIKFLAIYEDEWLSKRQLIEAMIRWRLNKFEGEYLDARKLELVKLTKNNEFKAFFDANHIDGHAKASFAWGLFHQGRLVSCASFRTNFNKQMEVARLATATDVSVRGGAGRLLAQVSGPLVTFSNNRLSTGDIYQKLGFDLAKENKSSYWYTDGFTRIWRFRCKRINEPAILAEFPTEVAQATGGVFSQRIFGDSRPLHRIEDYGHRLWIKKS